MQHDGFLTLSGQFRERTPMESLGKRVGFHGIVFAQEEVRRCLLNSKHGIHFLESPELSVCGRIKASLPNATESKGAEPACIQITFRQK